jgi:hypothetical protein
LANWILLVAEAQADFGHIQKLILWFAEKSGLKRAWTFSLFAQVQGQKESALNLRFWICS